MKKERWVVSAKRADFQAIADRFGIDPVIARLIRNRDVTGEKEIEEYLFGDLEQLHDPLLMKDMERAADLIAEKIREKKPIRIIGDYDIDGVKNLKEHDWAGFARKYNGPGYAENAYDQKLKNAYENFKNKI